MWIDPLSCLPARLVRAWSCSVGRGLTGSLHHGLVRAVLVSKPILACAATLLGLLTVWSTVRAQAQAGASSTAEMARNVLQGVEADESASELVSRAINQAHATLDQAAHNGVPDQRAALEATALEWAEIARDLKRARDAEQASDRLEQSLSGLQTELVHTRASVEQALARVGRARQELLELERNKAAGPAAAGAQR